MCVGRGLKAADFPRLLPEAVTHSALIIVQCHQVETHARMHTHAHGAAKVYPNAAVYFYYSTLLSLCRGFENEVSPYARTISETDIYTCVQMSTHAVTLFSHTNKAIPW